MDQAGRNAISARGFALVAQRMAALMRERFDLGFVDVGGWDTHVRPASAPVAPPWATCVSQPPENGNRGTDHGHGTTYWLLGGGLSSHAGGRIVGEQVEVNQKNLFQNRDHPVLNGLIRCIYTLRNPDKLAGVAVPAPLPFPAGPAA